MKFGRIAATPLYRWSTMAGIDATAICAIAYFHDNAARWWGSHVALACGILAILLTGWWAIAATVEARRARESGLICPVVRADSLTPAAVNITPAADRRLSKRYLPRDRIDADLNRHVEEALSPGTRWIILVVGPDVVGKSRTMFEALRHRDGAVEAVRIVAPYDLDALRTLTGPNAPRLKVKGAAVLWLDNFARFLNEGLSVKDLTRWRESGPRRIVAGTFDNAAGAHMYPHLQDHIRAVELGPTTRTELQSVRNRLSADDFWAACKHGWAAFLVAAPMLETKLQTGRHEGDAEVSYEGQAVVKALGDWARCGRTIPPSEPELFELWRSYLHPTLAPSENEPPRVWCTPVIGAQSLIGLRS
ncbi:hypothetical protein [Mycolicibacterium phocaicum]|uniref:hypothetical protein n=1 Tax=Mycolicibacterium phocaicum TaxID=319706 RepID=UPI0010FDA4C2|nr:hypothetical protein [Mycolicibacterium phocaicum]